MIHSARPTVLPVVTIVFCCFVLLDMKSGDGRTTCAKTMITTAVIVGWPSGSNQLELAIYYRIDKQWIEAINKPLLCKPHNVHISRCLLINILVNMYDSTQNYSH